MAPARTAASYALTAVTVLTVMEVTVLTVMAVTVLTLTTATDASRILAVATVGGRSQWNFMSAVLGSLTDAGHRVTVFTPFPEGGREGYEELDTSAHMPARADRGLTEMMDNYRYPSGRTVFPEIAFAAGHGESERA